jgi:smad nuclear-interacting protein 1
MGRTGQEKWEQKPFSSTFSNDRTKKSKAPRYSPSWKSSKHPEPNPNNPVIKHTPPTDSMIPPPNKWRLYVFKDLVELETIPLEGKDSYLLGRDRRLVDIPTDHESCSKQHAVIQFRAKMIPTTATISSSLSDPMSTAGSNTFLTASTATTRSSMNKDKKSIFKEERMELSARPYLIDLDSVNGTTLNGITIEPRRYYELRGNDLIRVADSSRDYVMLEIPSSM